MSLQIQEIMTITHEVNSLAVVVVDSAVLVEFIVRYAISMDMMLLFVTIDTLTLFKL